MNNSKKTENTQGFNVSYDNSFSAIKSNIYNFTGGEKKKNGEHQVGSEEAPNKPMDKIIRKAI